MSFFEELAGAFFILGNVFKEAISETFQRGEEQQQRVAQREENERNAGCGTTPHAESNTN